MGVLAVADGLRNPTHVVLLLVFFALWIVPSILVARLAERKGRSFGVYLVASLVIGWWFPLIAAVVLPRRRGTG